MIVISMTTIQITSGWLQHNEGLSQSFCFVWNCQMQFSLWWCEEKKRFAFEETALAVNWGGGTCGDRSLHLCLCDGGGGGEGVYVHFVCAPAIIQQLLMLMCVFECLCLFMAMCVWICVCVSILWAFTADKFNFTCHSPISIPNSWSGRDYGVCVSFQYLLRPQSLFITLCSVDDGLWYVLMLLNILLLHTEVMNQSFISVQNSISTSLVCAFTTKVLVSNSSTYGEITVFVCVNSKEEIFLCLTLCIDSVHFWFWTTSDQ